MMPSRNQRLQIAARSSVDERSILRAYRGLPVRAATFRRVSEAAAVLGIEPPTHPDDAPQSALSQEREEMAARIREVAARIGPRLPDVDPHDLQLILERKFRRWGSGQRFFIRRSPEGHYVF